MLERTWTRPRPTPAQLKVDALVGVAAAAVSVTNVELYRSGFGTELGWHGVEAYMWFALSGLLLAGRRALPLTTLVLESAVFIVVGERWAELGVTFTIQMILFASLYAAWAWSRRLRLLLVTTAVVLVAMFGWLLYALLQPDVLPRQTHGGLFDPAASALIYSVTINVVYFFGAIAWGHLAWRGARERSAAEHQTALELALADEQRERAVADERVRIARDLHDVVAHHVSSIGVQAAGAERLLARDPEAARTALTTIGSSSREAVTQMHQLVHLLRDDDATSDRAPQPGLADLADLADADSTPVVDHRVVGRSFAVPSTTAHSLFRIGQEAVTNARRHAAARRVSVVLRYVDEPHAVELEVLDDGRGCARTTHTEGSCGYGLTGIRERTALHGGEAEIGPRPHHGFRVRVRIPVRP